MVDRLEAHGSTLPANKVWPAEVEARGVRPPAIQEACVIAAKDAYRGETVKAIG
ncbi:MAG: hypothetical protein IPO57_13675 [Rhodocyclales bacterium]|nr:hypothetical protein [Rhodocyclales bacterium]